MPWSDYIQPVVSILGGALGVKLLDVALERVRGSTAERVKALESAEVARENFQSNLTKQIATLTTRLEEVEIQRQTAIIDRDKIREQRMADREAASQLMEKTRLDLQTKIDDSHTTHTAELQQRDAAIDNLSRQMRQVQHELLICTLRLAEYEEPRRANDPPSADYRGSRSVLPDPAPRRQADPPAKDFSDHRTTRPPEGEGAIE